MPLLKAAAACGLLDAASACHAVLRGAVKDSELHSKFAAALLGGGSVPADSSPTDASGSAFDIEFQKQLLQMPADLLQEHFCLIVEVGAVRGCAESVRK